MKAIKTFIAKRDDNINVDYLIPRVYLYVYTDADDVENQGLLAYPSSESKLLSKCVMAHLARIPDNLRANSGLATKKVYRVHFSKLAKERRKYVFLARNFPGQNGRVWELRDEQLSEVAINQQEAMCRRFEEDVANSFANVPMVAIYSEDGMIPGYACSRIKS